jgi:hypothetical protein
VGELLTSPSSSAEARFLRRQSLAAPTGRAAFPLMAPLSQSPATDTPARPARECCFARGAVARCGGARACGRADVSPFVSPGPRSWLSRAKAHRIHNPRVGASSLSPALTKALLILAGSSRRSRPPVSSRSHGSGWTEVPPATGLTSQCADQRPPSSCPRSWPTVSYSAFIPHSTSTGDYG